MTQLLPHLTAIERSRAAFTSRVLPPSWRTQAPSDEREAPLSDLSEQAARIEQIQKRKQGLLRNNTSQAHSWVRQRFAPGTGPISLDDILTMHRVVAEESGIRYDTVGVLRKDAQRVVEYPCVGNDGLKLVADIRVSLSEVMDPTKQEILKFLTEIASKCSK